MYGRWGCVKLCGKWPNKKKKKKIFKEIWIQPAAGDAGGALGAILAFLAHAFKKKENY